jgi:Putative beta-barrel porin-2, OmpL-like. bbp2
VNLRNLVPALALAAVTAAPAMAADAMPAVSFNGWVDTIFSYSDDDSPQNDAPGTAKDDTAGALGFTSAASLKANWKVTDALSAKINLWFDPEFADVQMREAYFAWSVNDTVTWSMGKYIDHLGWLSAEPTGLYTVNASLIGYTAAYGNDVLGTSIAVAPKGSPLSGSFHIVNGYFTGSDATNADLFAGRNSDTRENTDLGFGLDVTYALPDDKGNINFELAYDMSSGDGSTTPPDYLGNAPANGLGGDVFLVGINATVKPVKPLMIGAEFQYLTIGEAETAAGATVANSDSTRLQGLLLANYAIEGASVPMSISGMIQYVTIDTNAADNEARMGLAAALLTNPLGSSNFGLNFEIGYFDITDAGGTSGADDNGLAICVEGLVSF